VHSLTLRGPGAGFALYEVANHAVLVVNVEEVHGTGVVRSSCEGSGVLGADFVVQRVGNVVYLRWGAGAGVEGDEVAVMILPDE
jgi:hypothetical protein